jgi:hypothetical protein
MKLIESASLRPWERAPLLSGCPENNALCREELTARAGARLTLASPTRHCLASETTQGAATLRPCTKLKLRQANPSVGPRYVSDLSNFRVYRDFFERRQGTTHVQNLNDCVGSTILGAGTPAITQVITHEYREGSNKCSPYPSMSVQLYPCSSSVRRQNFWDRRVSDLAESWPHLGLIFRRRFCGAASADVGWSVV